MNKINLNLLFILSSIVFSSSSFSDESIYRIDYIIFKFLPDIETKEKFKTPEISFSDELINITDLKYPEFNKPDSLENNLPYQDLFQDISISRIITQSNLQEENTDDDVRMSENQVFFQNDSGAEFAMEEIVQTLKRSKNYRVIDQNSWFQEIKDQSLAPAVLIKTKIDDGDIVEPHRYYPIIPMALVNEIEGIGTGFSSKIPPFYFYDIVKNLIKQLLYF